MFFFLSLFPKYGKIQKKFLHGWLLFSSCGLQASADSLKARPKQMKQQRPFVDEQRDVQGYIDGLVTKTDSGDGVICSFI